MQYEFESPMLRIAHGRAFIPFLNVAGYNGGMPKAKQIQVRCPDCGGELAVAKTHNKAGTVIIRTRKCRQCGNKLQTSEIIRSAEYVRRVCGYSE
jgi:ribosomal protein S27E